MEELSQQVRSTGNTLILSTSGHAVSGLRCQRSDGLLKALGVGDACSLLLLDGGNAFQALAASAVFQCFRAQMDLVEGVGDIFLGFGTHELQGLEAPESTQSAIVTSFEVALSFIQMRTLLDDTKESVFKKVYVVMNSLLFAF